VKAVKASKTATMDQPGAVLSSCGEMNLLAKAKQKQSRMFLFLCGFFFLLFPPVLHLVLVLFAAPYFNFHSFGSFLFQLKEHETHKLKYLFFNSTSPELHELFWFFMLLVLYCLNFR
jgi:hypothetical protein